MGYFQVSDQGNYANQYAWNKVAHMLYLESPAGSGQGAGYSSCVKGGEEVACKWDDVSQAEAYAHSLKAFFKVFPEYASNELYLTGESYFGQARLERMPCDRLPAPPLGRGHSPLHAMRARPVAGPSDGG